MENLIFASVFVFLLGLLAGYLIGSRSRGKKLNYTNGLPRSLFRIISTDKTSSVLEEVGVDRKRFLVSTDIFAGRPVRPKDIVRKIKSHQEFKELKLPILGYPPFVKNE